MDWVTVFANETGASKLDPGQTGKSSAFSDLGGWYQLWFAKGKSGGIVLCGMAYGGKTDPACGVIARQVAEQWYAALPE